MYKNFLGNENTYVAYAQMGEPVGYIFAYLKNPKGKVNTTNIIELEALFIDEAFRKNNIGKLLLNSLEEWAKETYKDFAIEITTLNTNVNAIAFYEHLGYKPVKTILRK